MRGVKTDPLLKLVGVFGLCYSVISGESAFDNPLLSVMMRSDARPNMMTIVKEGVFKVPVSLLGHWDIASTRQATFLL